MIGPKIRIWTVSDDISGVRVVLTERSLIGYGLSRLIEASDVHWIKFRGRPVFCWIDPWRWTWHVGTEDHNLGSWWWDFGQWLLNQGYRLEHEHEVWRVPITAEQLKEHLPEDYEFFAFLLEDDDEEGEPEC
jgi:hypothetical protein